jgi:hypothetical protein
VKHRPDEPFDAGKPAAQGDGTARRAKQFQREGALKGEAVVAGDGVPSFDAASSGDEVSGTQEE